MLPSEIITRARYLTKTTANDGTGDNTNLLAILNDYYLRQATIFINTNQDKFGVKAYTDLDVTANQETYSLPSDCVKIKRMEITYDGTNWKKVHFQDVGENQQFALDQTNIANRFSTASPYAEIFGDNLYLRPIPTSSVTSGLMMWYIARPSLLSTISSVITTPLDYQGYLVYGVAAEIATRQGNDAFAASMFQKWEDGRAKIEATYAPRDLDQFIDFKPLPNNMG